MYYTRNKDCFKKTTVKVEHNEARKNILNLVKELVSRDGLPPKTPAKQQESNQNKCKNSQNQEPTQRMVMHKFAKQPKEPIFCESIYQSVDPQILAKNRRKNLIIEHVMDYSIKAVQNKSNQAQKQYISLLESKIEEQQQIRKNLREQLQRNKQSNKLKTSGIESDNTQKQKLLIFYHKARNIIVIQSVELLQCKRQLLKSAEKNEIRLRQLDMLMAKSQQFLQVNRRSIEKGSPRKANMQQNKQLEIQQLKDTCQYQKKTIEFLRKQAPIENQFNSVQLLRHEINRISRLNEELLAELSEAKQQQSSGAVEEKYLEKLQNFKKQFQVKKRKINQLQTEILIMKSQAKQYEQKNYKLKQEKQCLISFLDEQKSKNDYLEQQIQKYEKQIHQLKLNQIKRVRQINLDGKNIATTQQLCRELKAYPRYYELLMSIINQYEAKVSKLQDVLVDEKQQKQKFRQWIAKVYHLLEQSQVPQQILQKHMDELYNLDKTVDCSKVEKFLRTIKVLCIGIDEKDIRQIEAELQQYIITIRAKNQVIKQVDCEDGSSVAASDTFTDQQVDE